MIASWLARACARRPLRARLPASMAEAAEYRRANGRSVPQRVPMCVALSFRAMCCRLFAAMCCRLSLLLLPVKRESVGAGHTSPNLLWILKHWRLDMGARVHAQACMHPLQMCSSSFPALPLPLRPRPKLYL